MPPVCFHTAIALIFAFSANVLPSSTISRTTPASFIDSTGSPRSDRIARISRIFPAFPVANMILFSLLFSMLSPFVSCVGFSLFILCLYTPSGTGCTSGSLLHAPTENHCGLNNLRRLPLSPGQYHLRHHIQ